MEGEWIDTTIGEQITLQRGIDITKLEQRDGTVPVISSGGVSSYHDTPAASGPGVVLGRKGVVGSVYFVASNYWPHDTTLWVKDFHGNDPRFVYYFFRWMAPRIATMDVGSANPTLNRNHVHPIETRWPPVLEQRAIAHILGALDDKMELNRRMNETLEAIARAIFKSWFVDFDPVRAKAAGRQPFGMDAETAALFPNSFQGSRLGNIPKGWTVAPLGDHVEGVKGLSYKGAGLSDCGIPLHNLNSVYEGGGYKDDGIKFYTGEYKPRHVLHPGDLIVTNTEQGFDFLLIGYPAIVPKRFGEFGLFTHHLFRVQSLPGSPLRAQVLYHMLMSPALRDQVIACTNGTTVNMLSSDGLRMPLLVLPPTQLIRRFEEIADSLYLRSETNKDKSRTLAAIRDALLPKLISGEIRVPNI
ncbi:MAG: restriction endonuclease subunit S [Terriglobia bacterium]|jgi:type I restriction enzyme S subunit